MNRLFVYHAMPYPLRVLAASLRGWQLQRSRYGQDILALVEQAHERESWISSQWQAWQAQQIPEILWHAAHNIPFYRRQWAERKRRGDTASPEDLSNWPVLAKDDLRVTPQLFVSEDVHVKDLVEEHTSGTTGKPLTLWMEPSAVRQWYALFEARWRNWYDLTRHDRWGIFGGQLVVPVGQKKAPFWVWNYAMKQLYLSSYHIAPQTVADYLQAIRDHGLVYLLGYASSLYSLAQLALAQNLPVPPMKAVISNAEPLYAHQREWIRRAFQCPVWDTYGLSENVCAASECASGHLHLWPEVGVTEVLRDDDNVPAGDGQIGRLVCTGLLNHAMPLIRYQVGDRAAIHHNPCSCGRSMPILAHIEGRMDDVIVTADGRRVGRLDPVFKADMPIVEAQIIQESLTTLRVLVVPAVGYTGQAGLDIEERLRQRVGDFKIDLQIVDAIPRSANGKFRAVISHVRQ